jgi:GNAT superfamily N-acetyltransferase
MTGLRFVPMADAHVNYVRRSFTMQYARLHGIQPALAGSMLEPLLGAWDTWIAEAEGIPGEILGWLLVRDPNMVGWLHVKKLYRGMGIGRALLGRGGIGTGTVDSAFYKPHGLDMFGIKLRWRPYEPAREALEWENFVAPLTASMLAKSEEPEGE